MGRAIDIMVFSVASLRLIAAIALLLTPGTDPRVLFPPIRGGVWILSLIFLIFALVLFVLAGVGVATPPYFNLLGWGLAFLTASMLVTSIH